MKNKLETLSLAVLKELAKEKNVKNFSSMKKGELVDALDEIYKQERGEKDSEPLEKQAKKTEIKKENPKAEEGPVLKRKYFLRL